MRHCLPPSVPELAVVSTRDWNIFSSSLRVVADRLWPFEPGDEVAPPAIVAVDLLEAADERSRRAATQLLQHS